MNKEKLVNLLKIKKIPYKIYEHEPLFTVNESKKLRGVIPGAHTKNLFLKNKKNLFFLFSCLESANIDLKLLKSKLNLGNVSFAKKEYLKKMLNVEPGAVTPYGLLNDTENKICFYLDLKIAKCEHVNFHPLDNRYTLCTKTVDFIEFMKQNNILVNIFDFDNYIKIND